MIYLFAGFAVAGLVALALWGFANASATAMARILRGAGFVVVALIGAFLAFRLMPAFTAVIFTLVWGWLAGISFGLFKRPGFMAVQGPAHPAPGKTSAVETDWLSMSLEHDSGVMDGTVKQGAFAGRKLSELDADSLRRLFAELERENPNSARLLEAWVARMRPDVTLDSGADAAAPSQPMSRAEALEVLGLEEGASDDEIRAAHLRLMKQVHPDRGGSDYLAAKLNEARRTLLGD